MENPTLLGQYPTFYTFVHRQQRAAKRLLN